MSPSVGAGVPGADLLMTRHGTAWRACSMTCCLRHWRPRLNMCRSPTSCWLVPENAGKVHTHHPKRVYVACKAALQPQQLLRRAVGDRTHCHGCTVRGRVRGWERSLQVVRARLLAMRLRAAPTNSIGTLPTTHRCWRCRSVWSTGCQQDQCPRCVPLPGPSAARSEEASMKASAEIR